MELDPIIISITGLGFLESRFDKSKSVKGHRFPLPKLEKTKGPWRHF